MTTKLTLIENPSYVIDFTKLETDRTETQAEQASLMRKISQTAFKSLVCIKILFVSFAKSLWETTSYSWVGFKIIVLHYHGNLGDFNPPLSLSWAIFRIFVWAGSLFKGVVEQTYVNFVHEAFPSHSSEAEFNPLLSLYGKEINLHHLRCADKVIDVSHVPETVEVKDLLKMFAKANFTDPSRPGYVNPDNDVATLRQNLETFVSYVTNRTPFLGTPPSSNIPLLLQFYEHIENACRFSIHKVNEDLSVFLRNNGHDFAAYDEEQQKKYKDLLENRTRVALDLAIAGGACGARFMGEATTVYFNCKGEESLQQQGTLESCLIEILADKRKQIALAQVEKLGRSETHYYSRYMENMGKLLGIPGTSNMVEHLLTRFDLPRHLDSFFKEYTVDCILEALNEKIKKSGDFRSLIFDWIKAQAKDWAVEKYSAEAQEKEKAIHEIVSKEIATPSVLNDFNDFIDLIRTIEKLPQAANWEELLSGVFSLDQIQEEIPGKNKAEKARYKSNIKFLLGSESLGKECTDHLYAYIVQKGDLDLTPFFDRMIFNEKISEMRKVIPTLTREQGEKLLQNPTTISNFISDVTTQDRENDFLAELNEGPFSLNEIATSGLPPAILEWLIVSHKILHPQKVDEEEPLDPLANTQTFLPAVFNERAPLSREEKEWVQDYIFKGNQEGSASRAEQLLSTRNETSKRFRFGQADPEKALLQTLFSDLLQKDPKRIMREVYKTAGASLQPYPQWKERTLYQLNSLASYSPGFIASNIFPLVMNYYYNSVFNTEDFDSMYSDARQRVLFPLLPRLINNTPIFVIRAANYAADAFEALQRRAWNLIVWTWIIQPIIVRSREIPVITSLFKKINLWDTTWFLFRIKYGNSLNKEKTAAREALYYALKNLTFYILKRGQIQLLQMTRKEISKRSDINQKAARSLFLQSLKNHAATP